jgi:hypothetical protein
MQLTTTATSSSAAAIDDGTFTSISRPRAPFSIALAAVFACSRLRPRDDDPVAVVGCQFCSDPASDDAVTACDQNS